MGKGSPVCHPETGLFFNSFLEIPMTTEAKLWVHVIPAMHWGFSNLQGKKKTNPHSNVARLAECFASSSGHVFELVMWVAKVFLQGVV